MRGAAGVVIVVDDFSFATRWAVAGSKADICIGGIATGDFGFLGSVDDSVFCFCRKNNSSGATK